MSKRLFPLAFLLAAASVQAQPAPPPAPVYDSHGHLIPHDGRRPDSAADAPSARPKKASAKKPGAKRSVKKSGKAKRPAKATRTPKSKKSAKTR